MNIDLSAVDFVDHRLNRILFLDRVDEFTFRGICPINVPKWGRIFGGQLLAQALSASRDTVAHEYRIHSLHAHFLNPALDDVPVYYRVECLRDSYKFVCRRVTAVQRTSDLKIAAAIAKAKAHTPGSKDVTDDPAGKAGVHSAGTIPANTSSAKPAPPSSASSTSSPLSSSVSAAPASSNSSLATLWHGEQTGEVEVFSLMASFFRPDKPVGKDRIGNSESGEVPAKDVGNLIYPLESTSPGELVYLSGPERQKYENSNCEKTLTWEQQTEWFFPGPLESSRDYQMPARLHMPVVVTAATNALVTERLRRAIIVGKIVQKYRGNHDSGSKVQNSVDVSAMTTDGVREEVFDKLQQLLQSVTPTDIYGPYGSGKFDDLPEFGNSLSKIPSIRLPTARDYRIAPNSTSIASNHLKSGPFGLPHPSTIPTIPQVLGTAGKNTKIPKLTQAVLRGSMSMADPLTIKWIKLDEWGCSPTVDSIIAATAGGSRVPAGHADNGAGVSTAPATSGVAGDSLCSPSHRLSSTSLPTPLLPSSLLHITTDDVIPPSVADAMAQASWADVPLARVPQRAMYIRVAEQLEFRKKQNSGNIEMGKNPESRIISVDSLHAALLAYLTDWYVILTLGLPLSLPTFGSTVAPASMDHTLHIHHPDFDASDWLLYTLHAPCFSHERGLIQGCVWDMRGRLIASVSQEAMIRVVPPGRNKGIDPGSILLGNKAGPASRRAGTPVSELSDGNSRLAMKINVDGGKGEDEGRRKKGGIAAKL